MKTIVIVGLILVIVESKSLGDKNKKSEPVQAASDPENYEHHWDDGNKGDTGYIKNAEDKASKGYKHFDSFHKKDNDKYDFEHHTAFGHGKKDKKDGYEHHSKHKTAEKGNKESDDDGGNDEQASHNSYKVSEDTSNENGDYVGGLAPLLSEAGYENSSGENEGYTSGENGAQANESGEYSGVVDDDGGETQNLEEYDYE